MFCATEKSSSNISNERKSVSTHFQKPRRDMKIRRTPSISDELLVVLKFNVAKHDIGCLISFRSKLKTKGKNIELRS